MANYHINYGCTLLTTQSEDTIRNVANLIFKEQRHYLISINRKEIMQLID